MKKLLVSIILCFLIFGGMIPSGNASANQEFKTSALAFKDVSNNYRFYNEVLYLTDKKIITGFKDGTFKPDQVVTRAQAAIMLGRALRLDGTSKNTRFKDVPSNVTGSGFIASAVEEGIIQGFQDGSFRPNEPVTRGQMAIFLDRSFNLENGKANRFKDIGPSMKAYQSVLNVAVSGIADGYTDGTYRPNEPVTRGQFSAFLARTLEPSFRIPSKDKIFVPFFDDIALGMTKEQVKSLERATLVSETSNKLMYINKNVLGFTASVGYEFENNKLVSVYIFHDVVNNGYDLDALEAYFVVMYDELARVYGPATVLDTNWYDDEEGYVLLAYWYANDHETLLTSTINLDYSSFGGISFRISQN